MSTIESSPRTVRQLFDGRTYAIDLYQRDYTWTREHLAKLMEDFSAAFERWRDACRRGVATSPYFIGPLILQSREDAPYIIDGQQRLTTMLLLLMRVSRELGGRPPGREIETLIVREHEDFPFLLQVEDYSEALQDIWQHGALTKSNPSDPERKLGERYSELDELFPEDLDGPAIAAFARWLLDEVVAVEIVTADGAVSYQMFETMNNRGQPLRPSDLFRHYLLARIPDAGDRDKANDRWQVESKELQRLGPGEDLTALRTVLQARYATVPKGGEIPADGALHAWSPEDAIDDALGGSIDFAKFLGQDLVYYGRWYRRFRQAGTQYTRNLEALYFVARTGAPQLYRLLLAPLSPTDSDETTLRKVRLAVTFVDILSARLAWSPKVRRRQSLKEGLQRTIEESRDQAPDRLALYYASQLPALVPGFSENKAFGLDQARRTDVHSLLARMSAYITFQLTGEDTYTALEARSGAQAFDVDTVLSKDPRADESAVRDRSERERMAASIGSLILTPKSVLKGLPRDDTASRIGALTTQDALTASFAAPVHSDTTFAKFNAGLDVSFRSFKFPVKEEQVAKRAKAMLALAELIWDPARLVDASK